MEFFAKGFRYLSMVAVACGLAACGPGPAVDSISSSSPGSIAQFTENGDDIVFFPFDSSTLSREDQEKLTRQAFFVLTYPYYDLIIEGHTDARGTREYNLALGQRRAAVVRDFLMGQGVPERMIKTVSYGKERPLAFCDEEACWKQNRRAVTKLKLQ